MVGSGFTQQPYTSISSQMHTCSHRAKKRVYTSCLQVRSCGPVSHFSGLPPPLLKLACGSGFLLFEEVFVPSAHANGFEARQALKQVCFYFSLPLAVSLAKTGLELLPFSPQYWEHWHNPQHLATILEFSRASPSATPTPQVLPLF